MRRTLVLTALFAFAVLGVVALASLLTYARVRDALRDEFARRVEWVALAGAADVTPRQVVLLRVAGRGAFATADSMLLALGAVRRSSQAARVFLVAPDGTLLLDTEADSLVGRPAAAWTSARPAIERALSGATAHSELAARGGRRTIEGFAPVRDGPGGEVVAVLGVESSAEFLAVLPDIGRLLATTAALAWLAVVLLAVFFVRLAWQQQALERSLARAENLASVGELAATLAHEVRNPLGVIQGAAERLKKHYQGPEPELFDYIRDEVARLSNTVRRTLDFARPAAGDGGGDVRVAVDTTLGLFAGEIEAKRIRLVRESAGDAPRVRLGGEELKQVTFNLVRNALEALPESGTLRVGWAGRPREVELVVEDDGPGMSPELLARVRRPFVTTRAQGTGLGLAIVDRLVRESGGRFELESAPGRGTTARVRLPRAEARAEEHERTSGGG
jgi:signal transduction histidine kinase